MVREINLKASAVRASRSLRAGRRGPSMEPARGPSNGLNDPLIDTLKSPLYDRNTCQLSKLPLVTSKSDAFS